MKEWCVCNVCGDSFKRDADQDWRVKCVPCWKKSKGIEDAVQQANAMPVGYLEKLIRLCHPDKHNNSDTSNEITAWLLEQRH